MTLLKPDYYYKQSGIIPYSIEQNKMNIILISTINKKKWTIPKGIIEPGLSASESAVKEAYEEAGIKGNIGDSPLGLYRYDKWGSVCEVIVYPFIVTNLLDDWPEKHIRERVFVNINEAELMIKNKELKNILKFLGK